MRNGFRLAAAAAALAPSSGEAYSGTSSRKRARTSSGGRPMASRRRWSGPSITGSSCGDGESVLQRTVRALEGCEAVLCSKVGYEPWGPLEAAGIQPNGEHAMEPIEEAILKVYEEMRVAGKLAPAVAQKVA